MNIRENFRWFDDPDRILPESHEKRMLLGCVVLCKTSPTTTEGTRICQRVGNNELCTQKYIDPAFLPLLHAAKAYLDGRTVAIRCDACELFFKLIDELMNKVCDCKSVDI